MTRTTFKALWFGGGGILATWIAVSPQHSSVPAASPATGLHRQVAASVPEELNAQAARLRERRGSAPLRPSTRNPFRFSSPKPVPQPPPERVVAVATESAVAPAPAAPLLTLSGIATKAGKRTAIITGAGQIYLAGEGDSVAGLYTVEKVDAEAVVLRNAAGSEQRLVLPK